MGRGKAYKNVICLGHLLDAKGKKMSKSLGNIVDPWEMIEKYGVDTLRLWMYSVNQPGESKNFDEKTVTVLNQQVFGLLYNVLAFYELYRDKDLEKEENTNSKNILDFWILSRFNELLAFSEKNLDNYKVLEPVRAIRDFVGDLSTWYLRRSRERIKEGDKEAKQTLYYVLKNLAKLIAPFAPFSAEDVWLSLRNEKDEESVHLTNWPKVGEINEDVLSGMMYVRAFASNALMQRKSSKIEVSQLLKSFSIKHDFKPIPFWDELAEVLKEEINVQEVKLISGSKDNLPGLYLDTTEFVLDTEINEELKEEGTYRKLVRFFQDKRKQLELTPKDLIDVSFDVNASDSSKKFIHKYEEKLKKSVGISHINFESLLEKSSDKAYDGISIGLDLIYKIDKK
jgi:isoleucyl-tRNA synthetase